MKAEKQDPGLDGVPPDRLSAVIQGYVADGAARITCTRNADGTWRVIAEFA